MTSMPKALLLTGWMLALGASAAAILEAQEAPPEQEAEHYMPPSESHQMAEREAFVEAVPAQHGRWVTVPSLTMPINPIHVALMHTGKVLVVAGSGNVAGNNSFQAAVWDPAAGTIRTFKLAWDMFCNGMVVLPDGRPFVAGGNLQYDPFKGEPRAAVFDPIDETFSDVARMSGGRWYPTATVLGDGSVLVYSGFNDTDGRMNRTVQIWRRGAWTAGGTAFSGVPLYPRQHLLPNGKVFVSGSDRNSRIYDPTARAFAGLAASRHGRRVYGTSVLLPLTPANGFKPKVMILGGGEPTPGGPATTTDTTELIDLSAPSPQWVFGPRMVQARMQLNATLLPNGKILVSGGSVVDEKVDTAVKQAQLYDPESNTLSPASTMQFARLYHSNTLLLPDGTVAAVGGNPKRGDYQTAIEIYSPPYLFKADGSPAVRPTITSLSSQSVGYGRKIEIRTPNAADIKSVVLVRAGAVTHAFDMEQRLVGLSFTVGSGVVEAQTPADGNLAPPGYYLLFILDSRGAPSPGRFVRLAAPTLFRR